MQNRIYRLAPSEINSLKATELEFYTHVGGNIPVIFLHGINSGACSWQYQFDAINAIADCYAWNMPGYGNSTMFTDTPFAEDYARLLHAWIKKQSFQKIILVGHSLGALIANAYRLLFADSLYGLVLVSPTRGYGHLDESEQKKIALLRPDMMHQKGIKHYVDENINRLANRLTDHKLQLVKGVISNITLSGITASSHLLAYSKFDYTELPENLPNATLCGDLDRITPFEDVKAISKVIQSKFFTIRDASHPCYLEQSEQFNHFLIEFITKIKE